MTVRIDVAFTLAGVSGSLHQTATAVIDVLRATTLNVRALDSGARRVVPTLEPDDAIRIRDRVGRDAVLLGGERNAVRIDGFDLDNSPATYTPERVAGMTIALTTTNGTRALHRVSNAGAAGTLCAAFANLDAVIETLARDNRREILIVCAGTEGNVSLEDLLCAGGIAAGLAVREPAYTLTDAARAAALLYHGVRDRLVEAVASSDHAQRLAQAGFGSDVVACAQRNTSTTVPVYTDGEIVSYGIPAVEPIPAP
jgi:2-phosphosulfolactate phosphatase